MTSQLTPIEAYQSLVSTAENFGFDTIGVIDVDQSKAALDTAGQYLEHWVEQDFNGSMSYMNRHGTKRWTPSELIPGTTKIITVRMHYLTADHQSTEVLEDPNKAYISRYALGRDYHKTLRQRLQKLATWLEQELAPQLQLPKTHLSQGSDRSQSRVFVDSAPVMEKAIAEEAGLGWIGKNTLVLDKQAGSWFFLGEIYTNIPIPSSQDMQTLEKSQENKTAIPPKNHCGRCTRCIEVCPTQAIVAPYVLDARRCISYLTIENKGPIPLEFRKAIGNRVFGCDDCQLFCPWNRFAKIAIEGDFQPRHGLDQLSLVNGLQWTPEDFDLKTQGSPIRRTGYYGWMRNLAVAAGNSPTSSHLTATLEATQNTFEEQLRAQQNVQSEGQTENKVEGLRMVIEHLQWAQDQHLPKKPLLYQ